MDILKGLCICLIVVGHCRIPEMGIRLIYLFHVPMFFFLSGLLHKDRRVAEECKKSARALLLPYLLGVVFVGLKYLVDVLRGVDVSVVYRFLASALVVGPKVDFLGFTDLQIGAIWFLPVLFICRVAFQALARLFKKKWMLCAVLILVSFVGTLLLKDGPSVLGMGQGVAAMFFYSAGVACRELETTPFALKWKNVPFAFALCFLSVFFCESLDLHTLKFPVWWWSAFSTLAVILFLVKCARLVEKNNGAVAALAFVGKNSILLLLVHYFEMMTFDWSRIGCADSLLPLVRLAIDLVLFVALLRIPVVKRLLRLS